MHTNLPSLPSLSNAWKNSPKNIVLFRSEILSNLLTSVTFTSLLDVILTLQVLLAWKSWRSLRHCVAFMMYVRSLATEPTAFTPFQRALFGQTRPFVWFFCFCIWNYQIEFALNFHVDRLTLTLQLAWCDVLNPNFGFSDLLWFAFWNTFLYSIPSFCILCSHDFYHHCPIECLISSKSSLWITFRNVYDKSKTSILSTLGSQ